MFSPHHTLVHIGLSGLSILNKFWKHASQGYFSLTPPRNKWRANDETLHFIFTSFPYLNSDRSLSSTAWWETEFLLLARKCLIRSGFVTPITEVLILLIPWNNNAYFWQQTKNIPLHNTSLHLELAMITYIGYYQNSFSQPYTKIYVHWILIWRHLPSM